MIDLVFIIFVSAVGVFIVLIGTVYLRLKARLMNEFIEYSRVFYKAANTLLDDDEIPDEFLALSKWMSNSIDNTDVVKALAKSPARMKPSIHAQKNSAIMAEFLQRRPELKDSYHKCMLYWFGAVTSLSPFYGLMARYAVQEDIRETSIVRVASRSAKRARGNNGGPPVSGDAVIA